MYTDRDDLQFAFTVDSDLQIGDARRNSAALVFSILVSSWHALTRSELRRAVHGVALVSTIIAGSSRGFGSRTR